MQYRAFQKFTGSEEQNYPWQILSGSTIKLFAVIFMIIDHVGACLMRRMLLDYSYATTQLMNRYPSFYFSWMETWDSFKQVYDTVRDVGRLAFPLFAFLLVEGYRHTSHKGKYALRLGIFALVSEPFFDYANTGNWFDLGKQNIFFTLLLGFAAMFLWDLSKQFFFSKNARTNYGLSRVIGGLMVGVVALIGYFAKTDYNAIGVLIIWGLYFLSENRLYQALGGAIFVCWDFPAPLSAIFMLLYNGKRGWKHQKWMYLIYPLHLLVLGFVASFVTL